MDVSKFTTPGTFLTIAKSKSGKTHMFRYVLYKLISKSYIKDVIVVSQTARCNDDYPFIDKKFILDNLDETNIKYLKRVLHARKKYREETSKLPPGLAIVLDDIICAEGSRDKLLSALATRARHLNVWFFYATQYPKGIDPVVRNNAKVIMLFQITNWENERFYYDICPKGSRQEFREFMRSNVHSFHFLSYFTECVDADHGNAFRVEIAPKTLPKFKLH